MQKLSVARAVTLAEDQDGGRDYRSKQSKKDQEHKTSLHMDYMYYLKALAKPMDQVFACVFPEIKKFTEEQVKIRKQHMKIHAQLKSLFSPDFEFE